MYAIINKKTKKFVTGTDYRYNPRRQFTSRNAALTWGYAFEVETEFLIRGCGEDYEIVDVLIEIIGRVDNIEERKRIEQKDY